MLSFHLSKEHYILLCTKLQSNSFIQTDDKYLLIGDRKEMSNNALLGIF